MARKLTEEQITEAREAFDLADKEGTGKIKSQEVGIVLRSLGHNPSQEDLQKLLRGRTEISQDDFMDMLDEELKDEHDADELRVAFTVFDRDGQGSISAAELRFMLANMGEKMNYDEVDMLLEEAGIGEDGMFRYNEFLDKLNSDH